MLKKPRLVSSQTKKAITSFFQKKNGSNQLFIANPITEIKKISEHPISGGMAKQVDSPKPDNISKLVNSPKQVDSPKQIEVPEIQSNNLFINEEKPSIFSSIKGYAGSYAKSSLSWLIELIKNYYGIILVFSLVSILLYLRYIEVNKRKKQVQDIVDKKKEKEIKREQERLEEIERELIYRKKMNEIKNEDE
jgi:uncharacterized membrane protein